MSTDNDAMSTSLKEYVPFCPARNCSLQDDGGVVNPMLWSANDM